MKKHDNIIRVALALVVLCMIGLIAAPALAQQDESIDIFERKLKRPGPRVVSPGLDRAAAQLDPITIKHTETVRQ